MRSLLNVNVSKSLRASKGPLCSHSISINVGSLTSAPSLPPWQIEEVPGEMAQDDLATDDVMILDTWEQVRNTELYHTAPWNGRNVREVLYLRVFP